MDPRGNPVGPDVDRVKNVRAENGFRAGFQRELEQGMRQKLPWTDIVANPHINSKIHVWKKEYGTLSDILSKSGIDWNCTTSMIEVEDEFVWEGYHRAYLNLKGVRYKTRPYYTHHIEIFRKDKATGANAVDPVDLANELGRDEYEKEGETSEKYVPLTQDGLHELEDNNIAECFCNENNIQGEENEECGRGLVKLGGYP
ncbi:hypothetical protein ACS0TY_034617 [Phlomoides rotata]